VAERNERLGAAALYMGGARAAAALVGEGGDRCGRRLKADRGGGLPETAACGAWWWRC
jgi:hypothetical protein